MAEVKKQTRKQLVDDMVDAGMDRKAAGVAADSILAEVDRVEQDDQGQPTDTVDVTLITE